MFSAKTLAYLSLIFAAFVLIMVLGMIVFPNFFTQRDRKFAFKWKLNPHAENFARWISHSISTKNVCIFYLIISILLIIGNQRKTFAVAVSSMIIASASFRSIKRITQRPRPQEATLHFKDYSFPSGHTTAGFVFFLSLVLALDRIFIFSIPQFWYYLALTGGMIVGRSRRYLKVHWLSDIITGAFLWCGCFIFSYLFFYHFEQAIFTALERVFFSL